MIGDMPLVSLIDTFFVHHLLNLKLKFIFNYKKTMVTQNKHCRASHWPLLWFAEFCVCLALL